MRCGAGLLFLLAFLFSFWSVWVNALSKSKNVTLESTL